MFPKQTGAQFTISSARILLVSLYRLYYMVVVKYYKGKHVLFAPLRASKGVNTV